MKAGVACSGRAPSLPVTLSSPRRLTQLDIESHLAQCLAESTDDVVW